MWQGKKVFCLDTKGKHVLTEGIMRKLFGVVDPDSGKAVLHVRLISKGKQLVIGAKATGSGFTVWKMKAGNVAPIHVADLNKALAERLK